MELHFSNLLSFLLIITPLIECKPTFSAEPITYQANNKQPGETLIAVLEFRGHIRQLMLESKDTTSLRKLLERYHEEVAVPALQDAALLAIKEGNTGLLKAIYGFVIDCRDSADEEVGNIAASVFQKQIHSSITIIKTLKAADALIVIESLEFGAANLEAEGPTTKELSEALRLLRSFVLKK